MARVRKRERSGKWAAYYNDQNGVRRYKSFVLKKDADAFARQTEEELRTRKHTPAGSTTITEACVIWLRDCAARGTRDSTMAGYRVHVHRHVIPVMGRKRLSDLTEIGVVEFQDLLLGGAPTNIPGETLKRSTMMARDVLYCLQFVLDAAKRRGLVGRNVVRDWRSSWGRTEQIAAARLTKKPRLRPGIDMPDKDDIRRIWLHSSGYFRPVIITALYTGLRAGEVRGLLWRDVDLDAKVIHVRQSADLWNHISKLKSEAADRTVPLPPEVVETLRAWKPVCPESKEGLVFPRPDGEVMSLSVVNVELVKVQVAAGIMARPSNPYDKSPKYSMHKFRHAAVSMFIAEGMTLKRLQVVVGHSSIKITGDLYGHLFPDAEGDQAFARKVQETLLNPEDIDRVKRDAPIIVEPISGYRSKRCANEACGKMFIPESSRARSCPDCRKTMKLRANRARLLRIREAAE